MVGLTASPLWIHRPINEDGVGRQFLEAQVYGAPLGAGPMNRACWHRHSLPRLKAEGPAVGQVDEKTALDHQEELVRGWVVVPGVVSLEDGKPKAVLVHTIDHDVAVALSHQCTLGDEVYNAERRIPHRLILVRLGGGTLVGHN